MELALVLMPPLKLGLEILQYLLNLQNKSKQTQPQVFLMFKSLLISLMYLLEHGMYLLMHKILVESTVFLPHLIA